MSKRRVVFVCCDGLGRNWIAPERTPFLSALAAKAMWCDAHSAVFPSVTRVSAASVATGCRPARHGLHGNRMGLLEAGRIVVRDVGQPDFRAHMRRVTGTTLRVPTLAERIADRGGFIAFSNVSPGAAYFLDPEHFGHVYHRAGSFAPGGRPIEGREALDVSHDDTGDRAMTERFCREVVAERRPAIAALWLCDPDHTLHGAPLGSPQHLGALAHADACVELVANEVAAQRRRGEEILFLVGSDHGQETIGTAVDVGEWLAANGLGAALGAGEIGVASQGTSALLYATERARAPLEDVLDRIRGEEWADGVIAGDALAKVGMASDGGLVAAINMARRDTPNPYGVPGQRWVAAEPGNEAPIGSGQHGGWGPDETRPLLVVDAPGRPPGKRRAASSLVDLAPTMLDFLALPHDGMDGCSLLSEGA